MAGEFGPLVRQWRRRAGMTQEQLAERSAVGVRTIRRMETGAESNFRLDTVRLLAGALDLTAAERRDLMSAAGAVPALPPEPRTEPGPEPPLAALAERLAQVLRHRWQRELEQRGAHNPFPLPVRWQPAPAELTDHWANIRRLPPGAAADPLDLTGDLTGIAEVYRRVPAGRLVVLGRAGAGKTILTLRFVLDHLATRGRADPVPVIFSLGSWDPAATSLRDWLVDRLLRDHPDLVAAAPGGSTLAAALVEAGRVLPVLDGFDEIPAAQRPAALLALNGTALPLLLTSRPQEYREAVAAGDVLTWAAGIAIADLAPADYTDYLRRASRSSRWAAVLAELRERPDSPAAKNLAEVLSTPLMVVLARTAGADPAEFLDTTRFPTPDALEEHLLSSVVPTEYGRHTASPPRPDWTVDRVQRWLGHLARHLDRLRTPDLAWWQLGDSVRRRTRVLGVALVAAVVTAVADWLVYLPKYLAEHGVADGLRLGLLDGLMLGPVVGLGFGLIYGLMLWRGTVFEPVRARMRLVGRGNQAPVGRTFATRFGAGLLGGFLVGTGHELAAALGRGLLHGFPVVGAALIATMLVYGLVFGLAAGLVFGLTAILEAPLDLDSATSPRAVLRTNRSTILRRILVLAPVFALAIAFGGVFVVDLLPGARGWPLSYGLTAGALGGLAGALSYTVAFTAWGQWLVFARVWLPLTGRLPWAVAAFLEDAYRRGVLRQVGAVYQFRHARLQEHLGGDGGRPGSP